MILYFDTETSGLAPGNVIQLSYIMQTEREVKAKNFFFAVPYVTPEAAAVHHLTVEKLADLSGGHTFFESLEEIDDDFRAADLTVAHNFAFDFNFMTAEFKRFDRIFHYKESMDTMKYFKSTLKLPAKRGGGCYKMPKLIELAEFFEVYDYDVLKKCAELFGDANGSHDARFDTAQMYLSVMSAAEKNPEVKEYLKGYIESNF